MTIYQRQPKWKRGLLMAGIVLGSLLTAAPVIGILGTVLAMRHAFKTLGSSGIADSKALSSSIGEAMLSAAGGLVLFPVGLCLLTACLVLWINGRVPAPPPLPVRPAEPAE